MSAPFDKPEILRLWHLGPLAPQFPLKCGGTTWQSLEGNCAGCGQPISPPLFHGEVIATFAEIFHIKAVGYCADCKLTTCFSWHLKPDCVSGYTTHGEWRNFPVARPPNLFRRILQWCGF